MAKHYIGMAGLCGYLPSTCGSYPSKRAAAEALASMHDYSTTDRWCRELLTYGYNDMPHSRGNEYAEIIPCDCDNPSDHNDD